ncbi:hypothetical protein BASA81_008859 [Batrachochytrium salamandrivorans]|nr:hypothetical protein BASA81_008859 [Batrachochytrium salamandrivorans]
MDEEKGETHVVSLVQRKKTKKQRVEQETPVVAVASVAEPETNAFTEAMRLHEMAQAWGLEEDSGDEGNQGEEDQEVFNGTGLGAAAPAPSAAAAKQGSLEERLERARLRAVKSRENRSVELADWTPALDEEEEEDVKGMRKSRSKKPTGAMQRVKRAFD